MKLKDRYDVLVIGAGPAGAVAAQMVARRGLEVLLVEKRQEIGSPVRCGEAIDYDMIKPYIALDDKWIVTYVDAFRVVGPSGNSVRVPPLGPTLMLDRKIYDRELVNEAIRAGAQVRAKTRVTGLIIEDDYVVGVQMVSLGQEVEVRAKITIACDGPESQVGRWAGFKTSPRLKEYYLGIQYLMGGVNLDDPRECQYHVGKDTAPGGYTWVFPKGEDKANVGIVITTTKEERGWSPQQYLDAFVERLFPDASVLGLVLGGIPVGGTLKEIVGNGIMLAGDAAHMAEPLTGGGINHAMLAGHWAAETAADAIEAGDWSKNQLQSYPKYWHKKMGGGIKAMSALRHMAINMSDQRYESLIKIANDLPLDNLSPVDVVLRVLRNDPTLLWHAKAFLFQH